MIPKFDKYACVGDSVEWENGPFTMRARLEPDYDLTPHDLDAPGCCYDTNDLEYGKESAEIIAAWDRGEWFYCGVIVTASIDGVELGGASLWGVDVNHPKGDNAYLSEVAGELEGEAIAEAKTKAAAISAACKE